MSVYQQKIRQGVCAACKRESEYTQSDHRIPIRLGGGSAPNNRQTLCIECHARKSLIEFSLFDFNVSSEEVREWFRLAFQDDPKTISYFIDCLFIKARHFEEVFTLMKGEAGDR